MKPYKHAQISARKFGGEPTDYMDIHEWFDQTKAAVPDMRHRMILHNAMGIYICQTVFGLTRENSEGKTYSVRDIGEQHVLDDLGHIPTLEKCIKTMGPTPQEWMGGPQRATKMRKLIMNADDFKSMMVD